MVVHVLSQILRDRVSKLSDTLYRCVVDRWWGEKGCEEEKKRGRLDVEVEREEKEMRGGAERERGILRI